MVDKADVVLTLSSAKSGAIYHLPFTISYDVFDAADRRRARVPDGSGTG